MAQHDSTPKAPSYRRQKKNGRDLAFVSIGGRRVYLGPHGSAESYEAYNRVVAELKAGCGEISATPGDLRVVELLNRFRKHAEDYYRGPDGKPSRELGNYLVVTRMVRRLYGRSRVRDFTPQALKAVRQEMIGLGRCRRSINRQVVRVRSVFKWGVSEGLVPVEVYNALGTLAGLRAGKSAAKERSPVRPVTEEQVEAVLPHVGPVVADMIRLQWLTGMRPGEVTIVRAIDIDTTGEVWLYRPSRHKTEHHGRERAIPLGPRAREIVEPWMAHRPLHSFLFSPKESDLRHRAARHAARQTPLSQGSVPGSNRRSQPERSPGERYTTQSYGRALAHGCRNAWPHPELSRIKRSELTAEQKDELRRWNAERRWTLNQLRHAAATRIRSVAGLEMARIVLGHSTMAVTETYYAEADLNVVMRRPETCWKS